MASLVEKWKILCCFTAIRIKPESAGRNGKHIRPCRKRRSVKKEIEYRADVGQMVVPHCKTIRI